MESLVTSKIRIKGGELSENPGVSVSGHIVSGQENIHNLKNSFTELAHFETQDYSFYFVFEGHNEEAGVKTEEMMAKAIQRLTSDEDNYSIRRIRQIIAQSDDQEGRGEPKFFPKLYRNGKQVILQLLLIKEFRDQLQSEVQKMTESFPNLFESNQEVKLSLNSSKKFIELKESENSLFDTLGSFTFESSSSLNRSFPSNLSKYLISINKDLSFIFGAISIVSRLNIDINYNDFNILPKARLESFISDIDRQNRKFHRIFFGKSPRSAQLRYMKIFRDNVENKFEVFGFSPFAAARVHLQIADLMKDLVGDWEE